MNTVLLIEDNLDIRENTQELLELSGYWVILAHNGKVGLDLARENKPDIILCDIMMPELNGYEVFHQLREDPATSAIPFVFITASVEKKDILSALEMGANGYVRKPFEPKELFDAIEQCLRINQEKTDH